MMPDTDAHPMDYIDGTCDRTYVLYASWRTEPGSLVFFLPTPVVAYARYTIR
jgi:hypothetical protein